MLTAFVMACSGLAAIVGLQVAGGSPAGASALAGHVIHKAGSSNGGDCPTNFPGITDSNVVCGRYTDGGTVNFSAPTGYVFTSFPYVFYGGPAVVNGIPVAGECNLSGAAAMVSAVAYGQNSFTFDAIYSFFQGDPCGGVQKHLFIVARYSPTISNIPSVASPGGSFTPSVLADGSASVSSSTPGICGVQANGSVSYLAAGTCTLTAHGGTIQSFISNPFGSPYGLAVDTSGNVYVADADGGSVYRLSPDGFGGYVQSTVATGFNSPQDVAIDSSGKIYVAECGGGKVDVLTPDGFGGYTRSPISASFNVPHGVAVDASGNIYVADIGGNQVYVLSPNGSGGYTQNSIGSGFSGPSSVAVDASGHVFVGSWGSPYVYELSPNGTGGFNDPSTIATGFLGANGIAVDALGKVYVSDYYGNRIALLRPDSNNPGSYLQTNFLSEVNYAVSVTLDASGTVYMVAASDKRIRKIGPSTGVPQSFVIQPTISNIPTSVTVGGMFSPSVSEGTSTGGTSVTSSTPSICGVNNDGSVSYLAAGTCSLISHVDATQTTIDSGFPQPAGVAVDASGNVYVADSNNNRVVAVSPTGAQTDIGSGFNQPLGLAVDALGNVYVADLGNNRVEKITPNGTQTTIGTGFLNPYNVAVDASGNVYVADYGNRRVEKITPNDIQTTIGSGFSYPVGVAVDASGNVYVADIDLDQVVKVVPAVDGATQSFVIQPTISNIPISATVGGSFIPVVNKGASSGTASVASSTPLVCRANGDGSVSYLAAGTCTVTSNISFIQATLGEAARAFGIAADASGNVYVSDRDWGQVQALRPDGSGGYTPTTIGSGLNQPYGVAVDASGNIYVADSNNGLVQALRPNASGGYTKFAIGSGFSAPYGVAVDASGNVYVADTYNHQVVALRPNGSGGYTPTTIASGFRYPAGVAVDTSGNVYVTDWGHNQVVALRPDGSGVYTPTTIAYELNGPRGVAVDASGNVYVADSSHNQVVALRPNGSGAYTPTNIGSGFNYPFAVAVDASGNVYVADTNNNRVVALSGGLSGAAQSFSVAPTISNMPTSATVGGSFTPVALGATSVTSSTPGVCGVNVDGSVSYLSVGTCTLATHLGGGQSIIGTGMESPHSGIAFNSAGVAFVADTAANVVYSMTPYGNGGYGPKVVVASGFNNPYDLAVDPFGNVFVTDCYANRVAKLAPDGLGGYTQSTVISISNPLGVDVDAFGNLFVTSWQSGSVLEYTPGGPGSYNSPRSIGHDLYSSRGLAIDASGNLYVANSYNNQVEKLSPNGSGGYTQRVIAPSVNYPNGVAVDSLGNVFVAETGNSAIEELSPDGDGGYTMTALGSDLSSPWGVGVDAANNVYADDTGNGRIVKIVPQINGAGQSFQVTLRTPTTPTITNIPASPGVGGSFTASVSTDSDGAKSVISSSTGVCSVTTAHGSYSVRFSSFGTCSLTASVDQSSTYSQATGSAQSFSVHRTPAARTRVSVTVGTNQATVSWANPVSNGDTATHNEVVYSTDNSNWSIASATLSPSATSYTVTGLAGNTPYWFAVIALDGDHYASVPCATTQPLTPGPFAPRTPKGIFMASGDHSVTVSWANPVSNGDATVHNEVAYSTNNKTWIVATATLSPSATSYTVTGLTNGQHYWFEVIALDSSNHPSPADASTTFMTPQPIAPNGALGISVVGGVKSAKVSWTNPASNGDPCSYNVVKYSTNGSSWTIATSASAKATSFTVSGLSRSTSYYFQVVAVDASGRAGTSSQSGLIRLS
jgi:sugar lactone lactonase YvrE